MIYITQVLRRDSVIIKSLAFQRNKSIVSFKFLYYRIEVLNKIAFVYLNLETFSMVQD